MAAMGIWVLGLAISRFVAGDAAPIPEIMGIVGGPAPPSERAEQKRRLAGIDWLRYLQLTGFGLAAIGIVTVDIAV